MSSIYARDVLNALVELASLIEQRANDEGVKVGEVKLGERAKLSSYKSGGVYVLMPADRSSEYHADNMRETVLAVPVVCLQEAYVEPSGTEQLLTLVGLVVDAVHANAQRAGKWDESRVVSVEAGGVQGANRLDLEATVTVEIRIAHEVT